ncbi:O-antigen ligase family protein [Deinococcus aestuarii]|uniref:O-antigen ligase family protein n=1 Tax=Deinococcus aestuarii TaxID=2774531 RepID=UPI001C0C49FE|nr:hypothetical protein [Deinococcus aestuarii]
MRAASPPGGQSGGRAPAGGVVPGGRPGEPPTPLLLPFLLYFSLILLLPVSANLTKAVLAAVVAVAAALLIVRRGLHLSRSTLAVFTLMQCTGLLWILYGAFGNTPGWVFSLMVYVIWPAFYLITFTQFVSSRRVYGVVRNLMILGLGLIGLFTLYFVLYNFGVVPATPLLKLQFGQGIAKHSGYTALRLYSISTMIFLIPYGVAKLLYPSPGTGRGRFWLTALAVGLGSCAVLFTGRRAALLTVGLSVFIALVFGQFSPRPLRSGAWRRVAACLAALVLLGAVSAGLPASSRFSALTLATQVQRSLFDPGQTADDVVRFEQANSLIDGWVRRPLVGAGLGASSGYVRSERTWNYELQYHLHLFQMGVLGVFLYSLGFAWIYRNGLNLVRLGGDPGSEMIALLTGLTCFLLANATNPYLQAYGNLWTVFLPVAVINLMKLEQTPAAWP